jgi:hypothetical protein
MLYPNMSCIIASTIKSKILAIEVGEFYPIKLCNFYRKVYIKTQILCPGNSAFEILKIKSFTKKVLYFKNQRLQ